MKIIAIGTTAFLENCVRGFISAGCTIQAIISIPAEQLPDNSIDIKALATETGAGYFETNDINSADAVAFIKQLAPDIIFAAWPKILLPEVLAIPAKGVIGTHPTALPQNRGRHPLQWQIVLGFRESKLSYFWIDPGVDSGELILQAPYEVKRDDTIVTLTERVNSIAFSASEKIGKELLTAGKIEAVKQDDTLSNTWRKRGRHDVLIDFRMNSEVILALIRSFTLPYPCATFVFEDHLLHVISAEISNHDSYDSIMNLEPGKIISVKANSIEIKVADGILQFETAENVENIIGTKKYIHPPTKYLLKYPQTFINLF